MKKYRRELEKTRNADRCRRSPQGSARHFALNNKTFRLHLEFSCLGFDVFPGSTIKIQQLPVVEVEVDGRFLFLNEYVDAKRVV